MKGEVTSMAIAEFTIIPIGTATTSLSGYVADLHKELEKHADIAFEMTPMGTILEGPIRSTVGSHSSRPRSSFYEWCSSVSRHLSKSTIAVINPPL